MQFRSPADRAYANRAFVADFDRFPPLWAERSAALWAALGPRAQRGLRYGPGERHWFDLYLPEGVAKGLHVWVHGGYWLAFGPETWAYLAAGSLARGWAFAMPAYTLAPAARLAAMTAEVAQAVAAAAAMVPGPVVVSGHSAGGHLSARMGCADIALPRLARVVPISPVAELAPLMDTEMNDTLRIDAAEAAAESPARLARREGVQAHVWVGGQERPAFLWQARTLSEEWACPWTVDPGRHHFDVIDALAEPDSPLTRACLDGA